MQYKITKVKQDYHFEMKSEHYHDYYEIYYLMSGKRKFFLCNKVYSLLPGDLVMIPKGEIHRTTFERNSDEDNVETQRVCLGFTEEFMTNLISKIGQEEFDNCFQKRKITIPVNRRAYIEELFDQILIEKKDTDSLSDYLCQCYIEEIMIFLLRSQKKEEDEEKDFIDSDLDMEKAAQYISNHFENQITLEMISKKYCMSTSYFSKRFKNVTGFGFKEYLNAVRIRHACDLLLTTDQNITEISYQCGFTDSNYFGDAFKKNMHMSPRDYRKMNLVR